MSETKPTNRSVFFSPPDGAARCLTSMSLPASEPAGEASWDASFFQRRLRTPMCNGATPNSVSPTLTHPEASG